MEKSFKPGDIVFIGDNFSKNFTIRAHNSLTHWFSIWKNENQSRLLKKEEINKSMIVGMWPNQQNPLVVQLLVSEQTFWISSDILQFLKRKK